MININMNSLYKEIVTTGVGMSKITEESISINFDMPLRNVGEQGDVKFKHSGMVVAMPENDLDNKCKHTFIPDFYHEKIDGISYMKWSEHFCIKCKKREKIVKKANESIE